MGYDFSFRRRQRRPPISVPRQDLVEGLEKAAAKEYLSVKDIDPTCCDERPNVNLCH